MTRAENDGRRSARRRSASDLLEIAGEADSLAPAVTRAAVILDLLAENGGVAAGPSELARRLGLPKSSIANICAALADAGLARRVGTGFALGPQAGRARRRVSRVGRPDPGVLRRLPRARGRVGRDHPARGARRHRDDVPRPARRPPAGPPDLADRPAPAGQRHRDRQGGTRLAGPATRSRDASRASSCRR